MNKTIINKRWVFFVFLFGLLVLMGFFSLDGEQGLSVAIIAVGVIFVVGYVFLIPNSYTFSSAGITVRYGFCLKTFLHWEDIRHIEDRHSGGKAFPWWREYEIGYFESKIPFHSMAYIPKNKKTKRLIAKYYHKSIDKIG